MHVNFWFRFKYKWLHFFSGIFPLVIIYGSFQICSALFAATNAGSLFLIFHRNRHILRLFFLPHRLCNFSGTSSVYSAFLSIFLFLQYSIHPFWYIQITHMPSELHSHFYGLILPEDTLIAHEMIFLSPFHFQNNSKN